MTPLATVRNAARRRAHAADAYRAAILDARAHGHTLAEIAQAAGVKRQNVWKLLQRNVPKEDA